MKKHKKNIGIILLMSAIVSVQCNCSKKSSTTTDPIVITPPSTTDVDFWVTKADQTILLQKQSSLSAFGSAGSTAQIITLDSTQTYQTVDGFGFSLTGGSADLINALPVADKNNY